MLLHLVFFQPLAQAVDDFGSALVFAYDVIKNGAHLGQIGMAIRQEPLRSLRVAENRAERQVKLVRDRARKFAQRGNAREMRQLVAMTRSLLFCLLALGDVEGGTAHPNRLTVAIEFDVTAPGDPAQLPIG